MFAKKLKKLRIDAGLSREELAKVLNLSISAISNYENDIRKPQTDEIWRSIANYFNVSVDYLMDVEDDVAAMPTVDSVSDGNVHTYLAYGGSSNPKKDELIKLINDTNITDEQIDLLTNLIESWK